VDRREKILAERVRQIWIRKLRVTIRGEPVIGNGIDGRCGATTVWIPAKVADIPRTAVTVAVKKIVLNGIVRIGAGSSKLCDSLAIVGKVAKPVHSCIPAMSIVINRVIVDMVQHPSGVSAKLIGVFKVDAAVHSSVYKVVARDISRRLHVQVR